MKAKLGYDDALDTFGVHGIGGTWGALATGLFATTAINANGPTASSTATPASSGHSSSALLPVGSFLESSPLSS